ATAYENAHRQPVLQHADVQDICDPRPRGQPASRPGRLPARGGLTNVLIPPRAGNLPLGPATLLLGGLRPNARVTFLGEIIDWMDVTLEAEALNIKVHPLPTNNVPPDFNGAVGSYALNGTVSTNNVAVGDPITLTVQIAGHGPIESLTLSSLDKWRDFRIYPPIARVETTDPFGLDGAKTFEQVIIPENAEVKEVPPVTFSFFDPEKRAYDTV